MFTDFKRLRTFISAFTGGGGLSSVATDATLTGDGTGGAPLSVVGGNGIIVVSTSAVGFTPGSSDDVIKATTASNDVTIDLPAASTVRFIRIKKMSVANQVILNPSGAELIDGEATYAFFNKNEATSILADGTGWIIL